MQQYKSNNSISLKVQKKAKNYGLISTVAYGILFPILLYLSLFSFMAFDNPRMTIPLGLTYIFLFLSIPLSIPIALFFIWLKYSHAEYKKALVFCALPLLTASISTFLVKLLEVLFL
jgi:hypothetical protein